MRDTATTMDADLDASMDAPTSDAPIDAIADAGEDASFPSVSVICDSTSGGDPCDTDADCDATERCVDGGCPVGSGYCTPAGRRCTSPGDCPAGSSCTAGTDGSVCVADDPDTCTTSETCPTGFRCEGGTCVDRRLPCEPPGGCPPGYACMATTGSAVLFCVDLRFPCIDDSACIMGFHCVDLLADGDRRCFPMGECASNADCDRVEDATCGTDVLTGDATCNLTGRCNDVDDCAHDLATCEDTHDTGLTECLPIGECTRDSDCPPRALCFDGLGPPDDGVFTSEPDGMAECVQRLADL